MPFKEYTNKTIKEIIYIFRQLKIEIVVPLAYSQQSIICTYEIMKRPFIYVLDAPCIL